MHAHQKDIVDVFLGRDVSVLLKLVSAERIVNVVIIALVEVIVATINM